MLFLEIVALFFGTFDRLRFNNDDTRDDNALIRTCMGSMMGELIINYTSEKNSMYGKPNSQISYRIKKASKTFSMYICDFCSDNREEKNYGEDLHSNSIVYGDDTENYIDFLKVPDYEIIS